MTAIATCTTRLHGAQAVGYPSPVATVVSVGNRWCGIGMTTIDPQSATVVGQSQAATGGTQIVYARDAGTTFTGGLGAALNRSGSRLLTSPWVGNATEVSVTDLTTNKVRSFYVGPGVGRIAVHPTRSVAYVTVSGTNSVAVLNYAKSTVTAAIPTGVHPTDLTLIPNGSKLYVANDLDNTVSVIDTAANTLLATISVPDGAQSVAASADGKHVYVAGLAGLSDVDPTTDQVVAEFSIGGSYAAHLALTPDGSRAVISYFGLPAIGTGCSTGSAAVVDLQSGQLVAEIPLPSNGAGVGVQPDQAPVARLAVVPAPHGLATQFDAAASTVRFGTIVRYDWTFGDGKRAVTSSPTIAHTYTRSGIFRASVKATDSAGTSTQVVFTGKSVLLNGNATALAKTQVTIP